MKKDAKNVPPYIAEGGKRHVYLKPKFLESMKKRGSPYYGRNPIWDVATPGGFGARANMPAHTPTLVVLQRINGHLKLRPVRDADGNGEGRWEVDIDLAAARVRGAKMITQMKGGTDPDVVADTKRNEKRKEASLNAYTLSHVFDWRTDDAGRDTSFVGQLKLLTAPKIIADLRRDLINRPSQDGRTWGDEPLISLSGNVRLTKTIIQEYVNRGNISGADLILSWLRKLDKWLVMNVDKFDWVPFALGIQIDKPKKKKRKRHLNRDEVWAYLRACNVWGDPRYRLAFRFLLATGARREAVAAMEWPEFELQRDANGRIVSGIWTIPPNRAYETEDGIPIKPRPGTKFSEPFKLVLNERALQVLRELENLPMLLDALPVRKGKGAPGSFKRRIDNKQFVFGQKLRNWHDKTKELHRLMEAQLGRIIRRFWRHDIRRTVASHLRTINYRDEYRDETGKVHDAIKITKDQVEMVEGRVIPGAGGHYQHGDYIDEKRTIMNKWNAWVDRAERTQPDGVPLQRVKRPQPPAVTPVAQLLKDLGISDPIETDARIEAVFRADPSRSGSSLAKLFGVDRKRVFAIKAKLPIPKMSNAELISAAWNRWRANGKRRPSQQEEF